MEYIDSSHFYLHVSGEPSDRNPDFSEIGAAPDGPLQHRPKKYVPFMVPVFDQEATLAVVRAKIDELKKDWETWEAIPVLGDIEKIHRWPYRPEMQFSLYDFYMEELELATVYDKAGEAESSLDFQYDLSQDPAWDPLDPLGLDREFVFGLGFAEILALLGDD